MIRKTLTAVAVAAAALTVASGTANAGAFGDGGSYHSRQACENARKTLAPGLKGRCSATSPGKFQLYIDDGKPDTFSDALQKFVTGSFGSS